VEDLAAQLYPYLGDYAGEINSWASAVNISIGKAILLNVIYEVEAWCTSIVARDIYGRLYHGRNLDFNLAPVLRNITLNVDFYKDNKLLYKGTTYAGYVGLLTGMRPGAFSISADERDTGYLWENLLETLFVPGTTCASFLIRDTLETKTNFNEAVKHLSETQIAAPIYIIVGGIKPNEGMVITRDRMWTANFWQLDEDRWFEVETNYDHWVPAKDPRRHAAEAIIEKIGNKTMSLSGIMEALSTPPVVNSQTTYTTLMMPANGNYTTWVRNENAGDFVTSEFDEY